MSPTDETRLRALLDDGVLPELARQVVDYYTTLRNAGMNHAQAFELTATLHEHICVATIGWQEVEEE